MSARPVRCTVLAALAITLWCAAPCGAQSEFLEADYSFHGLRLESLQAVTTWEEEGVRIFVAEEGATIRQGPVRLAAPRMVVWFDKTRSSSPDVRAALVRVYAEGIEAADGRLDVPVRLVEGKDVRRCGGIFMQFSSTLSFVWDCPLRKPGERAPSPALARAEKIAGTLEKEMLWETVPAVEVPERRTPFQYGLKAEAGEVFMEDEQRFTAVYTGDVHASYNNMELRADTVVLWYDVKTDVSEIYAQGNVRLSRKPGTAASPRAGTDSGSQLQTERAGNVTEMVELLRADEVFINPSKNRGLATNVEFRMRDPRAEERIVYVFRGERVFLVDSKTLTVREGSVTSCAFARPHYQLKAGRMQVVRQRPSTILSAWDVTLQVGKAQRSLLRVPFVSTDLTQRAYLLTDYAIGTSRKFGFFMQTAWRPLDLTTRPAWVESWTVNLDYYGARGLGVGTELLYSLRRRHEGELQGYYVRDTSDEDATGRPVPTVDRGLLHSWDRWQASRNWRIETEYHWLSDEGFLNEYFETDFENAKTPESYFLARYLRNSTYLALLYRQQVNEFLTQLTHKPSLDVEVVGLPLGRMAYEGSVQAGRYNLELTDLLVPAPPDPPGLTRLHTEQKVSLPFSVGIVRLDPFVRALATWASKSAQAAGTFSGSESRTGVGAGITASTNFSRSFDASSKLFDLNRLRHVVIPHAGIETLTVSGADSADFILMDAVDAIDSGSQTTIGLRQRLQTKRRRDDKWESVNWAELDVAYVSRSSDSVLGGLDQDFMRADFEMLLSDHISLHSRDNRFGLEGQNDLINAGVALDYLPRWFLSLDYDHMSDTNSTLSAELSYQLSDRYRLLVSEQYELDSWGTDQETNLETRAVIRRMLDQWVLDVGIHYEKSNDEFVLIFGFGPRSWGVYKDTRRAAR